jgi:DNA-binding NarL/FixJ family response regulator
MDERCPRILVAHRDLSLAQAVMSAIERAFATNAIAAVGCDQATQIADYVQDYRPNIVIVNVLGFAFPSVLDYLQSSPPEIQNVVCGLRNCDSEILAVIQAGATACETVGESLEELIAHIESIAHGKTICPPLVARILFREVAAHGSASVCDDVPPTRELTGRELQIIALVERGLSNKEIANELSIGLQTVKNHVHHILEKLRLCRRTEAAHYARENGLLIEVGGTSTSAHGQPVLRGPMD